MKTKNRKKGAGTLVLRGKVFEARWRVNGKMFSRTTGETTRREAEKKLAEFVAPFLLKSEAETLEAIAARVDGARRNSSALPIAEAWEAFDSSLSRRAVSPMVNRIYAGRFGVFADWMRANRPEAATLADVDAETAQAFMQGIRAKSSPKTFNDYRALLSQMWRVLDGEAGLKGRNPWKDIAPLVRETHTRRELTVEELERAVASVDGEMRVLFALGIYTGLRLGDCLALTWGAVDLVRGFIQWTPHKTAKHGTVVRIPLFPALARILAETPERARRGLLVPGLAEDYARCTPPFCRRIKAVFESVGIATQSDTDRANPKTGTARKAVDVGFHSFRHTFVSLCANAGVPLHIVQAIVGHSNAAMTAHYFHVSDDALRGAVAALPDVTAPHAAAPALPASVDAASAALDALRTACEGLTGAGLTSAQWKEAAAILEAARRRA